MHSELTALWRQFLTCVRGRDAGGKGAMQNDRFDQEGYRLGMDIDTLRQILLSLIGGLAAPFMGAPFVMAAGVQ
jgi:hypothetical protein